MLASKMKSGLHNSGSFENLILKSKGIENQNVASPYAIYHSRVHKIFKMADTFASLHRTLWISVQKVLLKLTNFALVI